MSAGGATFAVVMPAYRSARFIDAALDSVLAQTVAPIEMIVVDDASDDSTGAVLEAYRERLIARGIAFTFIGMAVNGGPSVARNTGVAVARANHIAFLDADDVWHPTRLEVLQRHLATTRAALLFHAYTEADRFAPDAAFAGAHGARRVARSGLLWRNPAQTSCVVMRRNHHARFDESMRFCEDHDLWLRIAETGAVWRLDGPALTRLGRPQLSAGGLSGNRLKMRLGESRVYFKFCQRRWLPRAALLPALLAFSWLKHLRSSMRR